MLDVLQQFRVLLRSVKRHYQWMEKRSGLGGAQIWALAEIAQSPGLMVTELAQCLALHQTTASNLVNRLVALELVVKVRRDQDQRIVRLRLTTKGKGALRHAPRPFAGVLQQALSELSPGRLAALHRELEEVIGHMRRKDARASRTPLADL